MTVIQFGWRQLQRDWRAGELTVLWLALVIAVASVTSVNVFTSRIHTALERQANDLLGGDMMYLASDPVSAEKLRDAREMGLRTALTVEFPTMTLAADKNRLVSLKAVSAAYPLRGKMRIADKLFAVETETGSGPRPGTVWADSQLLTHLGIDVGDQVTLGASRLDVGAVLISEPDQSGGMFFGFAPRLLMNMDDLTATQLVQPASRVRYRLLLAGEPQQIEALREQWRPELLPGEQLRTIKDARPQINTALQRAESFLGLAALVSVLLAGTAVAMAARRFVNRHLDSCAVMRCLGAEQRFISRMYLSQMILLGLIASGMGVALGYLAQGGLVALLGPLANVELPAPTVWPVVPGMLTGMIALLGFAIPPILQLANVPTLRVLRRDIGQLRLSSLSAYSMGVIAFILLAMLQAQNIKLALLLVAGLLLLLVILAGLAVLLVWLIKLLARRGGQGWRFGLVNISRRAGHSVVQMVGFSVGLMALLLLTVVRTDLMTEWEERLPENSPNRFLINVQPAQVDAVEDFFASEKLAAPSLYPMVRARLVEINAMPVSEDDFESERGKRLASREFNLSWAESMQPENELVAGHWWNEDEYDKPWLSVEEGIAEELGLALGDTLTYNAGGLQFTAEITSLRRVEWDSFHPNFFVLAPPQLLQDYPASFMTAFYLPESNGDLLNRLLQTFPNVTVFDVAGILEQVRGIIERVTLAIEYVFLFTVLAGLMVMYAAIHATLDERIHEAAILRTLGARRGQLLGSIMLEYTGLGLLSGLVAAVAAGLVGMVIAERIFELSYVPSPTLWLGGMLIGAIGIGIAGTLGTRFVVNQPPLQTLHEQG